jgi:meso-butanediol dehydrogenase / (S,S)-butanediol dehydrogenase / diacetyl reductase
MDAKGFSAKPVVLVTGGGSGIGAATAKRLAKDWQVVICGRRREPLEKVAAGSDIAIFTADVGDPKACEGLIGGIVERFGRIDGLVLNAGIVLTLPFEETTLDAWNQQLSINLTGPFVLARTALPLLLEAKGAVVSVTSVGGLQTGPGLAAYSASKAGLMLMTQALAYEHAKNGLRANIVAPGWIRTEMGDEEMATMNIADDLEGAYAKVSEHVPQRRAGSSEEAAEAIAWLLSPAASFVNGAVLAVDGGSLVANVGMTFFDKIMENGPAA